MRSMSFEVDFPVLRGILAFQYIHKTVGIAINSVAWSLNFIILIKIKNVVTNNMYKERKAENNFVRLIFKKICFVLKKRIMLETRQQEL